MRERETSENAASSRRPQRLRVLMVASFVGVTLLLVGTLPAAMAWKMWRSGHPILDELEALSLLSQRIRDAAVEEQLAADAWLFGGEAAAREAHAAAHDRLAKLWPEARARAERIGDPLPSLLSAAEESEARWDAEALSRAFAVHGGAGAVAAAARTRTQFQVVRGDIRNLEAGVRALRRDVEDERRASWQHFYRLEVALALLGVVGLWLLYDLRRVLLRYHTATLVSESMVREREAFLSIASHELKTPITTITLHAQGLLRSLRRLRTGVSSDPAIAARRPPATLDVERSLRQLASIERQATQMARLVDELLDAGRPDRRRFELARRPADLVSLVHEAVAQAQSSATRHELRVTSCPQRLVLQIDAGRIEQVLSNLLGNAVKYSPEGRFVEVRVHEGNGEVVCSIEDHGMGIPAADRRRLFQSFFRAGNARRGRIPGFGLGLYICREIVERHGGRMWCESEEGRGSTFHFALPLRSEPVTARFRRTTPVHV